MTPEVRTSDASTFPQAETRFEVLGTGMIQHHQGPAIGLGSRNGHLDVSRNGQIEVDKAMDGTFSSKPLDTVSDTGTSKGSKLASDNHVRSMVLVPHVIQTDNHVGSISLVPHASHKLSINALRERLKDKLKEKLKPKLRRNLKHRQELTSPVNPLVPRLGVALSNRNGESAHVEHQDYKKPYTKDVAPLKVLTAGVKTESEEEALAVPSSFFSLGKEPTGQLVLANVSNGRKKAGNKTSQLSRVNRFADNILQFVGDRSVPEKLIRGALGNNPDVSKAIRLLLSEKRLKRLGDGGKGCAYVYVRTDMAEAKTKTKELDEVDLNAQAMIIEREFVRELERTFPATNKLDPYVWDRCGRMQGEHLQCDV